MSGRKGDVYCSDVLYPDSGQTIFPYCKTSMKSRMTSDWETQQVSAAPVIAQDLLGVCALKVSASCGVKSGVRVNILNQECASKESEILVSHSVCWDEQLVKLHVIVTVCWQSLSGISGGKLFLVSKFFTSWTVHHLWAPAVLKVCVTSDTSSFLVRIFGNIAEIVNILGTSQFIQHCSRWAVALCAGGLMSLVTQFQSKPNSGVLRHIRVWVHSPKSDIQEPR
jgi:hypothetical protein